MGVLPSISRAADPIDTVSVFNTGDNAWVVRYGKAKGEGNGNKKDDLAVVLKIGADPNGDDRFVAKLLRYDNVFQNKYALREGYEGKITLTGKITTGKGNGNTARRPIRIAATGAFVDDNDKLQVVTLKGLYHPGANVEAADQNKVKESRKDDRLTIHVKIRPLNPGKKEEAGLDTNVDRGTSYHFVAFLQDPAPCEEEPDTDVLAEEEVTEEEEEALPADPDNP